MSLRYNLNLSKRVGSGEDGGYLSLVRGEKEGGCSEEWKDTEGPPVNGEEKGELHTTEVL